jgi:hypothetical protein
MAHHVAPRSFAPRFRGRISLATASAVAAIAMIGAGTFAVWQSTASGTAGAYSAATVTATETDTNSTLFTTAVSNLLDGDFLYRYRTLSNTGSVSQTFSATATGSGGITAAGGLKVAVDSCSVAWTTVLSISTCAGTTSPVLAATGLGSAAAINFGTLTAGSTLSLRYTFSLPSGTATSFQGTSGTVAVAITGTPTATPGERTAG